MKLITKCLSVLAGVTTSVAIMVAPATALASSGANWGIPYIIEYSANLLLVQVNGVNYFAGTNTGCTSLNQSLDTLKVWQSMAQSALLSGHNVNMYWSTCGTGTQKYITVFDLNNN